MDNKIIEMLKDKDTYFCLTGTNLRLYWQDSMEGTFKVTDQNKHIICAGWQVITWKRGKPITLYFGQSFDEALTVFQKNNS